MMQTIESVTETLALEVVAAEHTVREVRGVYCCDLLSMALTHAREGDLWITVMGNVNAVAVAVVRGVSGILLAHDVQMDEDGLQAAKKHHICILRSKQSAYELSRQIAIRCRL